MYQTATPVEGGGRIGSPDDPGTPEPGAPKSKNDGGSALRRLQNPNAITVGMAIAWFTLTWLMLDGFRKDLKGDIAGVEVRLTERIAAVEGNVAALEVRLTKEIAAVESRLSANIRETEARLERRSSRVEDRLDRILEILPGSCGASGVSATRGGCCD